MSGHVGQQVTDIQIDETVPYDGSEEMPLRIVFTNTENTVVADLEVWVDDEGGVFGNVRNLDAATPYVMDGFAFDSGMPK